MPEIKQDCNVWSAEGRTLRFTCAGAATADPVWWYLARTRRAPAADRLLELTMPDGSVQTAPDGDDLIVSVILTSDQTIRLPPGRLHHELWCTDETGADRVLAEGAFNLIDSLAI